MASCSPLGTPSQDSLQVLEILSITNSLPAMGSTVSELLGGSRKHPNCGIKKFLLGSELVQARVSCALLTTPRGSPFGDFEVQRSAVTQPGWPLHLSSLLSSLEDRQSDSQ